MYYKGVLHFWELEGTYLWLKKEFWNEIYKRKGKNSWGNVSKKIHINAGTLGNYVAQRTSSKKAQCIPLNNLIKLSKHFGIKLEKIENKNWIVVLKTYSIGKKIESPKFPVNFLSKEWAIFVGGLLSEGYLNKKCSCQFWNTDKNVIEEFLGITNKATKFNNRIRVYKKHNGHKDGYYINYPVIIGKILTNGLGMKPGKKSIVNSGIPELYLKLRVTEKNNRIIASLLRWIFAGDGWSVFCKDKRFGQKHRNVGVGFARNFSDSEKIIVENIFENKNVMEKNAPKLLKDCGFLLYKHFGIKMKGPYLNKKKPFIFFHNGKRMISIRWLGFIYSRRNLEKFNKYIGFPKSCMKSNKKLKNGLKSYENIEFDWGETIYQALKLCSKLGTITKHNVIKSTNLSTKWIETLLLKARKDGLLSIVGGGGRSKRGYGRDPHIYKITDKGLELLREKENQWRWDF